MSKTITELNSTIEELEKRIKSISTSHATLAQIIAVRDCLEQVKICLGELNQSISDQEEDASVSELNALEERVAILENDISAIQTDLGEAQDDIVDINAEISNINTSIGEQNTTITNLQTTQTNLSTTQTNQASTITYNSNQIETLKTRVNKCENNITGLTGGFDLTEIEERINSLEVINGPTCAHEHYTFHSAKPSNKTLYTREYYFSCSTQSLVFQKFRLEYVSTGEGTLTIEFFEEQISTGETLTVDLSAHPYVYEFSRHFFPQKKANNIMLKVVSTTDITYKLLDLWVFGSNVRLYNCDQDIKIICFDNKYYITRNGEDCFTYGIFLNTELDSIDLDNLPNSRTYNDHAGVYRYAIAGPYAVALYPYKEYSNYKELCFYFESVLDNGFKVVDGTLDKDKVTTFSGAHGNEGCGEIYPAVQYSSALSFYIRNSEPVYSYLNTNGSKSPLENMSLFKTGEWLYITYIGNNYKLYEDGPTPLKQLKFLAIYEDGYFYFINRRVVIQVEKIAKGDFATAFFLPDGVSFNAYIFNGYHVKKFLFTLTNETSGIYSFELVDEFDDCCCYYELENGYTIKKTRAGWIIEKQPSIAEDTSSTTTE